MNGISNEKNVLIQISQLFMHVLYGVKRKLLNFYLSLVHEGNMVIDRTA